ncbi:hypothetical protein JM18_008733 [Phytophthora kernoviae]|uniref:ubiquitinyl hydrolase 1 n=1 Tax=Phytophthora kernoviae TaxID=325452 RepID=A0A8T0LML9_9STRA|nr:hypothetical protein JM16_008746 [Phytophthora kernoviae]KAG2510986.1 hypothetical protein JM18_008733 [Phytophthora kernoviae]
MHEMLRLEVEIDEGKENEDEESGTTKYAQGYSIVDEFLRQCLSNISQRKYLAMSLKLVTQLATLISEAGINQDRSYSFVQVVLDEINEYKRSLRHELHATKWSRVCDEERVKLPALRDHVNEVKIRLLALRASWILDERVDTGDSSFVVEQMDAVWKLMVVDAFLLDEAALCFQWIELCMNTPARSSRLEKESPYSTRALMPLSITKYLLMTKFRALTGDCITLSTLCCFHSIFRRVNLVEGGLDIFATTAATGGADLSVLSSPTSAASADGDKEESVELLTDIPLVGLDELWQLAVAATDAAVAEEIITLLVSYHLAFSPSFRHTELPFLSKIHFLEKCMEFITTAKAHAERGTIVSDQQDERHSSENDAEVAVVNRCVDLLRYFLEACSVRDGLTEREDEEALMKKLEAEEIPDTPETETDGENEGGDRKKAFRLEHLEERLPYLEIFPSPMKDMQSDATVEDHGDRKPDSGRRQWRERFVRLGGARHLYETLLKWPEEPLIKKHIPGRLVRKLKQTVDQEEASASSSGIRPPRNQYEATLSGYLQLLSLIAGISEKLRTIILRYDPNGQPDQDLEVSRSSDDSQLMIQFILKHLLFGEREEKFFALSVEVSKKRRLTESLALYVEGESLEGENAYFCERVQRKVSATKRVCIKRLPQTLVCHLKRFEFDYSTMEKMKINDYLEFPTELDMYPYTSEALASTDKIKHNGANHQDKSIMYDLVGVVVHSGTSDTGHYYSFIKDRRETKDQRWLEFNDEVVREFDVDTMGDECFGGEEVAQTWDPINGAEANLAIRDPVSVLQEIFKSDAEFHDHIDWIPNWLANYLDANGAIREQTKVQVVAEDSEPMDEKAAAAKEAQTLFIEMENAFGVGIPLFYKDSNAREAKDEAQEDQQVLASSHASSDAVDVEDVVLEALDLEQENQGRLHEDQKSSRSRKIGHDKAGPEHDGTEGETQDWKPHRSREELAALLHIDLDMTRNTAREA